MHAKISYACLLTLVIAGSAAAQGVGLGDGSDGSLAYAGSAPINNYAALATAVGAGAMSVDVDDASAFAGGDVALIWQVQAGPFTSGDSTDIDLAVASVGHYEVARIVNVVDDTLDLGSQLANSYSAPGTQIVRVPQYTDVTVPVGETLAATAWNGTVGGVVAFLATGSVTIDGNIDVSGQGFRGGAASESDPAYGYQGCSVCSDDTPVTEFDTTCMRSLTVLVGCPKYDPVGGAEGRRGESIDGTAGAFGLAGGSVGCGRGNRANGGGGGGHVNAGGAGGGNGGRGGLGGDAFCSSLNSGGVRGAKLLAELDTHLAFGGGGGGGQQNNDNSGDGGHGGGVIWLRASALLGSGNLRANGGAGGAATNDGGGGGGAGGSVYVALANNAVCGLIQANGGAGSDSDGGHGDGSSGGGGHVRIDAADSSGCGVELLTADLPTGHTFPAEALADPGTSAPNGGAFGCGNNAACANPYPYCSPSSLACEACSESSHCTEGNLLICSSGTCVECVLDEHCDVNEFCDGSNTCVPSDIDDPDAGFDAGEPDEDAAVPPFDASFPDSGNENSGVAGGAGCGGCAVTSHPMANWAWLMLLVFAVLLRRRINSGG